MNEEMELFGTVAIWAAVAVLGSLVSYYAIRAWSSSRERSFAFLAGGFIALSVASGLTWFTLYFSGQDLVVCEAGSTGATFVGLGSILYALRSRGA